MIEQNRLEFEKSNILRWHSKGYKGKGSAIVVLDDTSKPHEHTRVITPLNDYTDKIGHKTNVCSVVREVAPEATIYAFSWFGSMKNETIEWIFEHKEEIDVINCSFSETIDEQQFNRLKGIDIPIIVASGNNSTPYLNTLPKLDWTIAIGAWEEYRDKRASYSNYGSELDVVAYTNIYIPTSDGYGRTMLFNGTSCAAPVVSGMLAIYNGWRKENGLPKMAREQARQFLIDYAADKYTEGFDLESGHGLFILPAEIPTIEQAETPHIEESDEMVFKDTGTHWARQEIDFISEQKIMNGFPDGTFQPDKVMTRAEVATVIARMMGFVKK